MFKKLKSLFIVEREDPDNARKPGKKEDDSNDEPIEQDDYPVDVELDLPAGEVSEEFADILLKAWQNNNVKGFDYLEFKKSLESLKDMEMDEATRYQSAFAMAKTMGVNARKIIDTAHHYVDVLKNEEKKFEKVVEKQRALKIEEKKTEAEALKKDIREKEEKLEALQKEIENDRQALASTKSDLEVAKVKIEKTHDDFKKTYSFLLNQVLSDIEKMKSFLK